MKWYAATVELRLNAEQQTTERQRLRLLGAPDVACDVQSGKVEMPEAYDRWAV